MGSLEIMRLSCEYLLQTMVSYLEYSQVIINEEVNTLSHVKAKGPSSDMNGWNCFSGRQLFSWHMIRCVPC